MTETVLPHFLTAGKDAVSITEFRNESGAGGATATHVVVSVTFPSLDVTIKGTTLLINDSPAATSSCTTTTTGPPPTGTPETTTRSCPAGDIAGGGTVRLIVQFSTSHQMTLTGTANYGESGNDNPKNNTNDREQSQDTLSISGTVDGKCVQLNAGQVDAVTASSTTSLSTQSTSATYGSVDSSLHLGCTPAEAGVLPISPPPLKTQVSVLEFLTFASGYATAKIDITPLPTNLNKFVLLEDTQYAPPFFTTFIKVPNGCDPSGLPPNPGVPAPGATESSVPPHLNDTCIASRSPLPKGGGELVLHVIGSPLDGHYGG